MKDRIKTFFCSATEVSRGQRNIMCPHSLNTSNRNNENCWYKLQKCLSVFCLNTKRKKDNLFLRKSDREAYSWHCKQRSELWVILSPEQWVITGDGGKIGCFPTCRIFVGILCLRTSPGSVTVARRVRVSRSKLRISAEQETVPFSKRPDELWVTFL